MSVQGAPSRKPAALRGDRWNPLTMKTRLFRMIDTDGPVTYNDQPCWEWKGYKDKKGYGQVTRDGTGRGKKMKAHRAMWECLVGPIPWDEATGEYLTLDHLCRNTGCINPAHCEPITRGENVLRSDNPAALNARKTHCDRGHEFTPENTYERKDKIGRECRTCKRMRRKGG